MDPYTLGQIVNIQMCYRGLHYTGIDVDTESPSRPYIEIKLGIPESPHDFPLFMITMKVRTSDRDPVLINIITDGEGFWEFARIPTTEFTRDGHHYIIDNNKCNFNEGVFRRLRKIIAYFAIDFDQE